MIWLIPFMILGAAFSYRRIRDDEQQFNEEQLRQEKIKLEAAERQAAADRVIAARKLAAQTQLAQQYLAMKPVMAGNSQRSLSPRMVRPLNRVTGLAGLSGPARKTIPNRPKAASLAGSFGHRAIEDINGEDPSHL